MGELTIHSHRYSVALFRGVCARGSNLEYSVVGSWVFSIHMTTEEVLPRLMASLPESVSDKCWTLVDRPHVSYIPSVEERSSKQLLLAASKSIEDHDSLIEMG